MVVSESQEIIPRHLILDSDSAALTDRNTIAVIGKGIAAVDNSTDQRTEIISGLYYDAIIDSTDHHAADKTRTVSVASITRSGSTATLTASTNHGFIDGMGITIAGADQAEYNGTFVISNHTATTFEYTVTGTPATPATGTITATKKIPVYSTLAAAIANKVSSIFVHSAADSSDITISSTDVVTRIIGESASLSTIPVNITCDKSDVLFESLLFSGKSLSFNGDRCIAFGCLFTGAITSGSAVLNDATGIIATDTSIVFDGGANGGLPTEGYGLLGGREVFSWTAGGDPTSGTLTVQSGARRGTLETLADSWADNTAITSLMNAHLSVRGADCSAIASRFIGCSTSTVQCILLYSTAARFRLTSNVFLGNSTWSLMSGAPLNDSGTPYREVQIIGNACDSNTTKYFQFSTWPASDSSTAREGRYWSINGNSFRQFDSGLFSIFGGDWNISGNTFDGVARNTQTFQINQVGGITASDTTIPYDTSAGSGTLADKGSFIIESEEIAFSSRDATNYYGCVRGFNGTTAAAHADDTTITNISQQVVHVYGGSGSLAALPLLISGNTFIEVNTGTYVVSASSNNCSGCYGGSNGAPLLSITTNVFHNTVRLFTHGVGSTGSFLLGNSHSGVNTAIDFRSAPAQFLGPGRGVISAVNTASDLQIFAVGYTATTGLLSQIMLPDNKSISLGRASGDRVPVCVVLTNQTGGAATAGRLAILDAANDDSWVNPGLVAVPIDGVIMNASAAGGQTLIAVEGIVDIDCDTVAVARNDYISNSAITNGRGTSIGAAPIAGQTIARALRAKAGGATGMVRCLIERY